MLVVQVAQVRLHQLQAHQLLTAVAVVVAVRSQAVRVVREAVAQEHLLVLAQRVLPTLAVVVEAVRVLVAQGEQEGLVLLFFLSQQLDTQAHPLEAQRSQQAAQTLS